MNYQQKDSNFIWHPYTPCLGSGPNLIVKEAKGNYLHLDDGRKILDAISSWWVNLHGHSHPYIIRKVQDTLQDLQQVMFAGFSHPLAVELSERILGLFGGRFSKAFFSDNGSTSIEVALKMCFQFWSNQGIQRDKIIAFKHSYHGDTFGAMSVAERGLFTKPFWPFLFDVEFVDPPLRGNKTKEQVQAIIGKYPQRIAGIIFEPLIQGAGGMLMHLPSDLDEVLGLVQLAGGLAIADEVMTGFGRTGKTFATDHLRTIPDIICLSKGLTGGVLPMGLTLANHKVHGAFLSDDKSMSLFHGHSFTGNALSCSAALASLDLLMKEDCQANISMISNEHLSFSKLLESVVFPVRDIRRTGTVLAIELDVGNDTGYLNTQRDKIYDYFLDRGVLLRPLGNIIYVLPPYSFTSIELDMTYTAISDFLRHKI